MWIALYLLIELFVWLPLFLLGLPIVVALSIANAWNFGLSKNPQHSTILEWPSWAWIWGNDDDGIIPIGEPINAISAIKWYIRNPVENLRYTAFGLRPRPKLIKTAGNCRVDPDADYANVKVRAWRWCMTWQGIKGGIWIQGPIFGMRLNIRLGWKLIPADAVSISPLDGRLNGCGIASQVTLGAWE
jgi:hypothetical protein